MSEHFQRKGNRSSERSAIEADVERTLAELLSGKEPGETVRTTKKIIKTPNSETTITYELEVNSRTGQQEVAEHITTTKEECRDAADTPRNANDARSVVLRSAGIVSQHQASATLSANPASKG